ncbi:MAG: adenylosuccinate synthetase [Candidatus Bathyarchaeia archaeon]|nr:adenylosuccinate synthetase [Candidatus Bathyarchaeota archaeon]
MTCTVLVGGFFGDEGKGKIASYLAIKDDMDANVRTGSVNAGHTVVWGDITYKLRMIPSGFVNPKTKLYLAAGCNVNPSIFLEEVKLTKVEGRIWIDRQASVIEPIHIERDRSEGGRIGTTGQGVGPAQEDRVKRIAKLVSEIDYLKPYLDDVALRVNEILDRGGKVLLEGTQGTYLSLIHGTYPYVTSRDTTASAICSEVGIGPKRVDDVIVVFKSYVTRVGKGPLKGELSEEEVRRRGWMEIATVTGRIRRAAPFDFELARRAAILNSATQIAITKLDSLYPEAAYARKFEDLPTEARMFIEHVENEVKVPVTLIGIGPKVEDIIDRRREIL